MDANRIAGEEVYQSCPGVELTAERKNGASESEEKIWNQMFDHINEQSWDLYLKRLTRVLSSADYRECREEVAVLKALEEIYDEYWSCDAAWPVIQKELQELEYELTGSGKYKLADHVKKDRESLEKTRWAWKNKKEENKRQMVRFAVGLILIMLILNVLQSCGNF